MKVIFITPFKYIINLKEKHTMANTFTVTVVNKATKEVTVHTGCSSVMSNLHGILVNSADGQFQYDSNHLATITDLQ